MQYQKEAKPFSYEILILLDKVRRNDPSITTLDIRQDELLDHHVDMLCEALERNAHVNRLRLIAFHRRALTTAISTGACSQLAALNIEKLHIICHSITEDGVRELARTRSIRHMEIYRCYLFLENVVPFLSNQSLLQFEITFNIFPERTEEINAFKRKMLKVCERNKIKWEARLQDELVENQQQEMADSICNAIEKDNSKEFIRLTILLPKGIEGEVNGKRLINLCVTHNAVNCIRYLLKSGVILDLSESHFSAFSESAENGKLDLVKLLLPYSSSIVGDLYSDFKKSLNHVALVAVSSAFNFFEGHERRLSRLGASFHRMVASLLTFWKQGQRDSKDMRYKFPMFVGTLVNNIKSESQEEEKCVQIMQNYSTIYRLLRMKRAIVTGKHPLEYEGYYDTIQSPIRDFHIECPVDTRSNSELSRRFIERSIEKLNNQLLMDDELALDWKEFPAFLIPKFRCLRYSSNDFTETQIEDHLRSCHLNRFFHESVIMVASDLPSESLRTGYASLKYHASGQPVQRYLGKFFIGLFSPLQHTLYRLKHGFDSSTISPEFNDMKHQDAFFFEGVLDVPDFNQPWTEDLGRRYQERFDIDLFKFKYFRDRLQSAINHAAAEKELVEHIVSHQSKKLMSQTFLESKRRGSYILFKQTHREYGISPSGRTMNMTPQQETTSEIQKIHELCDEQFSTITEEESISLSPPTKRGKCDGMGMN